MSTTAHIARIVGPVSYLNWAGRRRDIPLGPCLIENAGDRCFEISWGANGEISAALAVEAVRVAQDQGNLVLLT